MSSVMSCATSRAASRAASRATSRAGHTLAELVVGLLLASLVGAAVVALLHASSRAVVDLVGRSEASELRTTVAALLHAETSIGRPGEDWALEGEAALRLRAFRGYGLPCLPPLPGVDLPDLLPVVRLGDRAPDPARDSVLVVTTRGRRLVADLVWVGPGVGGAEGDCPAPTGTWTGPVAERWRLAWGGGGTGPHEGVVLLRLFERGRYSLEDGAFRYRQGMGGRQPLTPEVLPAGSRFTLDPRGQAVVELPPLAWPLPGDVSQVPGPLSSAAGWHP
jgi:hypothetical protein